MKRHLSYTLLVVFFVLNIYSQDGKLNQAKQNLNQQNNSSSQIDDNQNDRGSSDSPSLFQDLMLQIFWNITYGVAIETIFEKESKMHRASIAKYSYINKHTGNFTYNDSLSVKSNLLLTNSFLRESKSLYGNNFNAKFRFAKRMDAEFGYLELTEKLQNTKDHFSLFSLMVNYHRIRTQRLDIWYGIGAMHVANNVNKTGFAFGGGAEWFIKRPISIYTCIKSANINQENVTKSKILLKYYQQRTQFFTGYQNFNLANVNINSVSLGLGYLF